MEISWETHGSLMGVLWETHRRPMDQHWESHGQSMGALRPMGDPLKSHGETMGVLSETHGTSTGLPMAFTVTIDLQWDFQGFTMLAHGTPTEIPWVCGALMGLPCAPSVGPWESH